MTDPNPYPSTDAAEQESKEILESLIDHNFVKTDIRTRDKIPNIDGTIELVDERQIPVGKLDVQLRTIGMNQTKYSCPASLVAYSMESTTLPVIIICVDRSTRRAFWRHVNSEMPEFNRNQQSFTIYFSEESDSIDKTGIYFQKWVRLTRDYKERIAQYPILSAEKANKLGMEGIDTSDRIMFQQFVDKINDLLDHDFITIKKLLFPSLWKLGVGIISSDQTHFHYQIYFIPYGDVTPLVCKLPKGSISSKRFDPNAVQETITPRQYFGNPEEAGRNFVFEQVKNIVEYKNLPIYGKVAASDVVFEFIDRYNPCLGLTPCLDRYSVKDLDYAFNHYLIQTCASVYNKIIQSSSGFIYIDLDSVLNIISKTNFKMIDSNNESFRFSISSKRFPIKTAFDSLRYLIALQVNEIERPFRRADLPISAGVHWIWSRYSRQSQINSVTHVLNQSVKEYPEFVYRNQLRFPKSPYLDKNIAIVFEYEPGKPNGTFSEGPGLREYHFENTNQLLPKLTVVEGGITNNRIDAHNFPTIKFDGVDYSANLSSDSDASFFFQPTPVLNMIYRMLSDDLSKHYHMMVHIRNI